MKTIYRAIDGTDHNTMLAADNHEQNLFRAWLAKQPLVYRIIELSTTWNTDEERRGSDRVLLRSILRETYTKNFEHMENLCQESVQSTDGS